MIEVTQFTFSKTVTIPSGTIDTTLEIGSIDPQGAVYIKKVIVEANAEITIDNNNQGNDRPYDFTVNLNRAHRDSGIGIGGGTSDTVQSGSVASNAVDTIQLQNSTSTLGDLITENETVTVALDASTACVDGVTEDTPADISVYAIGRRAL